MYHLSISFKKSDQFWVHGGVLEGGLIWYIILAFRFADVFPKSQGFLELWWHQQECSQMTHQIELEWGK